MPNTKQQRQAGSIEIILIGVIVLIIAFVGWFVWHAKQNADKTLSSANASANSATVAKPKTSKTVTQSTAGSDNNSLQQDLNTINSQNSQSDQDLNSANSGLNDQSTFTSVP